MGPQEGLEYRRQGRTVVITHRGRPATTLRGAAARRFLERVESEDPQRLMARVTGQYRHGNERTAAAHPRKRQRPRRSPSSAAPAGGAGRARSPDHVGAPV